VKLTLKRILFTDDGTQGVLLIENNFAFVTMEPEWKDNLRGISCIPAGQYLCKRVDTPKHGNTFQVMQVPGRDSILFHSGNVEVDTEGCILLGMEPGIVDGKRAVVRSKEAFGKFLEILKDKQTFNLNVKNL
jgi:hypothetical protein